MLAKEPRSYRLKQSLSVPYQGDKTTDILSYSCEIILKVTPNEQCHPQNKEFDGEYHGQNENKDTGFDQL